MRMDLDTKRKKEKELIDSILEHKNEILELQQECEDYYIEDRIYRFYHQSFKTFKLQEKTKECFDLFIKVSPVSNRLNKMFLSIYHEGVDKEFNQASNSRWNYETRPILEAFFHIKHLLDMMVKYGINADETEREGNPGWYTVLYLYNIR